MKKRLVSFVVFLFVIAIGGSFLGLRCSSGWFAHNNNNKKKKHVTDSSSTKVALALSSDEEVVALLNTTMCSTKCGEDSSAAVVSDDNKEKDCQTYLTPIRTCYSSSKLFPEDPSWSGYDIFDAIVPTSTNTRRRSTSSTVVSTQTNNTAAGTSLLLVRTIYQTTNGTCVPSSQDVVFRLELQQCVGPFGRPRPWGIFAVAESTTTTRPTTTTTVNN